MKKKKKKKKKNKVHTFVWRAARHTMCTSFIFFYSYLKEMKQSILKGIRKVEEFTFRANPCTVFIFHSFILSFCIE